MFEWILDIVVLVISTSNFTSLFYRKQSTDKAITFLLLFTVQVMTAIFLSGSIFHSLWPRTVLLIHTVFALVSILLTYRRIGSFNSKWKLSRPQKKLGAIGITYTIALFVALALTAYVGHLLPPYSFDGLGYHLVVVATWIHAHQLVPNPYSIWANTYPKNAELFFTWLYLFAHGDAFVHVGQWFFAIIAIVATIGIVKRLGLDNQSALMAGTLFFLTPTVLLQSTVVYNDLAFAAMFLVFFYFYLDMLQAPRLSSTLLAGMAAGIALGIKSSAIMYIGVSGLILLGTFLWWQRKREITLGLLVKHILLFLFPFLLFGSEWYIHTWIVYGNPFYPFTMSFHGHVVFRGLGTVQNLIMIPNTPKVLLHHAWWQQVWLSWFSLPTYYAYDMPIGGLGLQWPLLELPAFIIVAIYAAVKRSKLLWQVLLPLSIIFILQPANWWARYTLFLPTIGTFALVYVLSWVSKPWLRKSLQLMPLILICTAYVVGASLFFGSSQKRISNLVAKAMTKALHTPAQDRTIGSVVFPDYRFVDAFKQPVVIGFSGDVQFPYPLYGADAKNGVFEVEDTSEQSFLRQVSQEHLQYVVCAKGDTYDVWAHREPATFVPVSAHSSYDVFEIK